MSLDLKTLSNDFLVALHGSSPSMWTMMALLFPVSQSLKIDSHKIDERGYFKAISHPVIVKAAQGTGGQGKLSLPLKSSHHITVIRTAGQQLNSPVAQRQGTMVLEVYIQVQ